MAVSGTAQLDVPETNPAAYTPGPATTSLAEILERILDKGIVIAGDIKIDLLDIELLTIRLRLFVSSVETARKAGIDWWTTDPALSSRAAEHALARENEELRERLKELEQSGSGSGASRSGGSAKEKERT
ncbi:gas vesicle protein [Actinacidiphila acididurans]|uniref:Gas vesicle protein n=1 Tax=Actinacidiphila acididurans TaxID=2784346 RepID=A0ABS2TYH9_9ACTN|nr:gas vesicle protein [Actinacidiphila acididurans]MBM9507877.1 gas vesicle protein [Actinacidiphila acididurans]